MEKFKEFTITVICILDKWMEYCLNNNQSCYKKYIKIHNQSQFQFLSGSIHTNDLQFQSVSVLYTT